MSGRPVLGRDDAVLSECLGKLVGEGLPDLVHFPATEVPCDGSWLDY